MDTTFKINLTQAVSYSTTTQSAAVGTTTTKVRIWTSTDAFVKIGTNPTATSTDSMPISGGIPEYFDITPGQKVAFLQQSVAGTGYVSEVSKN